MSESVRPLLSALAVVALFVACGPGSEETPSAAGGETAAPQPDAGRSPTEAGRGIVLALAQFVTVDGKPKPGPARLEFLYRDGDAWKTAVLEDDESNVFHKAMMLDDQLLSLGGTAAVVKLWKKGGDGLVSTTLWKEDFGGKWSRMRDAEIADLYGDGGQSIAVATHDQGVVAVLRPDGSGGYAVEKLDEKADTFVHEIEIGDLDGDGALEVYATPSEPNRMDGSVQSGEVVRYVPSKGEGRVVVADLLDRHAKEILVADVDGDGRDELYVSVEGHVEGEGAAKRLAQPVEILRYEADTKADAGVVIGTLEDSLSRFLTPGDVDGDGKRELVAASFSQGIWLFRPAADPNGPWDAELVDRDSGGFEHASLLTDLDGDGKDELYVASDKHKEVRRYVWDGTEMKREVIYVRPDDRPIFTWNLMPVPRAIIP